MMRQLLSAILAVFVFASVLWAFDEPPDKGKTPRERYQILVQEQREAMQQFLDLSQKARTPQERLKIYRERYPRVQSYVRRFLELAESAPEDPAAVDSLIWIAMQGGCAPEVTRAVDMLAASHAENPRLGEVAARLVPNLVFSLAPSAETLLRAIVAKNPDRGIQGQACIALGQYLKQESELVRALKGETNQARQLESYYAMQGAERVSLIQIRAKDPEALSKESASTFERAAREFADVSDYLRLVDPTVQAKLFENPNLGIGKPAPEITGEALDGKPIKLSDYRGMVVVLNFWGDWCGPSRGMYPYERSLLKRMDGKPFVMLGVNSDPDMDKLKQRISLEKITWKSWWDGGKNGPIANRFGVSDWPTVYVLDHRGIIQKKFLGFPGTEWFDEAIDALVETAIKESRPIKPDTR
jgi:thiol-disulfide isomerase/thioredoxin